MKRLVNRLIVRSAFEWRSRRAGQSHLNCHCRIYASIAVPEWISKALPDSSFWHCSVASSSLARHHYLFTSYVCFLFVSSITTPVVWNVRKESQNRVSSTANRYVFCFINAGSVDLFSIRIFLRTKLAFPFQRLLSFQVCSLCPWWEWQTFWAD